MTMMKRVMPAMVTIAVLALIARRVPYATRTTWHSLR